jgi:hypothetical protein
MFADGMIQVETKGKSRKILQLQSGFLLLELATKIEICFGIAT